MAELTGRVIHSGEARGTVLRSPEPIGFFGNVDPERGVVTEPGHPLEGRSIAGCVLVFPRAKGSTVGSYVLYALSRRGLAPVAMLLEECETIVAVGAIIGDIPTLDGLDLDRLQDGVEVRIEGDRVLLEEPS